RTIRNKLSCVWIEEGESLKCLAEGLWELTVLVSPFFFWGTTMVAMKEVIPRTGSFFVSAFRLIPTGFLLIGFTASRGRPFPSGLNAWLSISLFALVDAACFQNEGELKAMLIDWNALRIGILHALIPNTFSIEIQLMIILLSLF
ncbi:hypothetical protein S245_001563, partial [Arachis hypogaea]